MIIRKAEIKDARAIAKISVDTWKDAYKGLIDDAILEGRKVDDKRISAWCENIQNLDFTVLVCEYNEVLGYLWAGPARDEYGLKHEIYALYVKTSAQRKGVGTELIKAYKKIIKDESFYLYMIKNNKKASSFYETSGGCVWERYNRKIQDRNHTIEEICYVFKWEKSWVKK